MQCWPLGTVVSAHRGAENQRVDFSAAEHRTETSIRAFLVNGSQFFDGASRLESFTGLLRTVGMPVHIAHVVFGNKSGIDVFL